MNFKRIPVGSVFVNLRSDGDRICEHIARGKGFEPQSRKLWGEWCAKRGTVLDIGAYSGLFAIGASLLGCTVLAFEPMPFMADRFEFNAMNNGCRIALMRAAVSDRNGDIDITYNSKVPMTAGASLIRKKGPKLRVATMTIDSFKFQQLTAIKMDVERAEPLVLKGARETLERCRPMMLVEALGESERAAVLAAVPSIYRVADVIDVRNMVLLPC